MNRREFLSVGAAGAFYIAAGGKAWGAAVTGKRVCDEKRKDIKS